jgi:hypothetical protein
MITLMKDVMTICDKYILLDTYDVLNAKVYRENNRLLSKLCDLVDIFASVNFKIVERNDYKTAKFNKRDKISSIFRGATTNLQNILQLLKEIRIKPAHGYEYTMWAYYFGLNEFER